MERLAGAIMLLWGWRRALAAWAAGGLAALSQPPFDFAAVCFVSFPVLVWLLDGAAGERGGRIFGRARPAFAVGWWFGFGYFLAGLWWTGNALLVEAEEFAWAVPLAVLGLPAVLALFYGLATALARLLWSDDLGRIFALAAAFGAAEWLRAVVLTGFPWNAIGYAAMPIPLFMQSAAVTGLFGMSALAVLVFAMPALLAARPHRRIGLVLAAVLIAAHAGFGFARLAGAPPAQGEWRVRIVQPSIDQSRKWDAGVRDRIFATYLAMSGEPAGDGADIPDLVIWPETSVPFIFTDRPDALAAVAELLDDGQMLFAGAVRSEEATGSGPTRYYNSVVAIDDTGEITDAVDKTHLVPFGEYLPFSRFFARFGIGKLVSLPGSFSAGAERHPLTAPGGVAAVPYICYEIIFPGLVARGARQGDLLLNVTNDAWYGDTPGPYQHLRQARLRAVETGLPLVRAANNGISAVVDAHGRIIDALALDAVGVIDAAVPLYKARGMRLGDPAVNSLIILILCGLLSFGMKLRPWRGAN